MSAVGKGACACQCQPGVAREKEHLPTITIAVLESCCC
jgi:hypothetical protein